jgi:phenylalanine-4-hydroxylase
MSSLSRLPAHLRKYVVEQDYSRYTSEDQAVWRFIMRQLSDFLSIHAHECYLEGLQKTGIQTDEIPHIESIDRHLNRFGWGALPVSGFIPPAAFMEFQSLGILPIASDMRSLEHLLYTPAPDIVHEAAGHAPILIHPEFAEYLRQYAAVASHAIISKEDLDQYRAIRDLSDLKEDPFSTPKQIEQAERLLSELNQNMKFVSEATLLSRMNWWTAEYGLIGDLNNPKIYGAGLLSSLSEAQKCLSAKVKKLPLSLDCIEYSYDITEPQPQLFVTPNFQNLQIVLEQLAQRLSFRVGGVGGLEQAKNAETVNTIELNSGVQISGLLSEYILDENKQPIFLKFTGPSQICEGRTQLAEQGVRHHPNGFSSPIGQLKGFNQPLAKMNAADLTRKGLIANKNVVLEFESGFIVKGTLQSFTWGAKGLLLMSFNSCRVTRGNHLYFDPAWGLFDMLIGEKVTSVFGGPADRKQFGEIDDFVAQKVLRKPSSPDAMLRDKAYSEIRHCRIQMDAKTWRLLAKRIYEDTAATWLMCLELIEIGRKLKLDTSSLESKLRSDCFPCPQAIHSIADGLRLASLHI